MSNAHIPPAIAIRGMLNHNFVDANFPKYCMVETGKKEKEISPSCFSLTQHTSPLSGCLQNLKTLALKAGEKSVTNFYKKLEAQVGQISLTLIRLIIIC